MGILISQIRQHRQEAGLGVERYTLESTLLNDKEMPLLLVIGKNSKDVSNVSYFDRDNPENPLAKNGEAYSDCIQFSDNSTGDTFFFPVKSSDAIPEESADGKKFKIGFYSAIEEFTASNGTVIPAGTKRAYAYSAL